MSYGSWFHCTRYEQAESRNTQLRALPYCFAASSERPARGQVLPRSWTVHLSFVAARRGASWAHARGCLVLHALNSKQNKLARLCIRYRDFAKVQGDGVQWSERMAELYPG